jgi:predicted dehydrogenase
MSKLKFGIVGGGSNFGRIHLRSAGFDSLAEVAAGCFSRDAEKNIYIAAQIGIPDDRRYPDYKTMADIETKRADKIDFVIISTPNVFHYEMSKYFLETGFHVMLDKPMAFTSDEAMELARLADRKGLLLNLAYTYTGYPIIKEMRHLVQNGDIGKIFMIVAEFPQGSVAEEFINTGKISMWRAKRDMAGSSCSEADLGVHIECLVRYVTGLKIEKLTACIDTFGYPSELELNSMIMLRYQGGAVGQYFTSKICSGSYSNLKLRVYGKKGSLAWELHNPDELCFTRFNEPDQLLRLARPYLCDEVNIMPRSRQSLSDGVSGALAQLYTAFINNILRIRKGEKPVHDYPDAWDGVAGMKYIDAIITSAKNNSDWVQIKL